MKSVLAYLGSIIFANLLVDWFGVISFGFLVFPAGAVVIGVTFSARDFVQRRYGRWWCWAWMLLATIFTIVFSLDIALASGSAFLISESVDWLVYTVTKKPFRERVILSNIFSTPIDSVVFVAIAFGWFWPAIIGQTVVKFGSSLIVLPFIERS